MFKFFFTVISLIIFLSHGQVHARKGYGNYEQEWDYVTVRPNAQMFWWLHYVNPLNSSTNGNFSVYEKPLLIWLQGGPGASSTGYGNFEELGPIDLDGNQRNHTWINDYNVLFIDNPIGSGFSHAESFSAYAKTNLEIAEDLLECIRNFYYKLPEFIDVPTYITAESYGGKMAAEFALLWFKEQKEKKIESNLKGVALGDSWISPIDSVISWAPFLLNTGMIDIRGYDLIQKSIEATKLAVEQERWQEATNLWGRTENVIMEIVNNIDFYNILEKKKPNDYFDIRDELLDKLMNSDVKEALGLNVTWGEQSSRVFSILSGDFMKPAVHIVERLLNETNLEIFVFTGQLDLIVATPGTLAWVEALKWHGKKKWETSERKTVVVDNIIEGYVKEYSNFKMYWINRSGHMVPADNPSAMKQILKHLTKG
ncbi:hypothetical protein HCN44_001032 [Aphidius gifuensis]|uniref:Carboxypeptidase n=1 Tax=Aphidius gifuensis TaxID=684658 RepID=A0A835CMJ5_APHGI|nr:hypothetical protein HCN44_001032 [Aphidius gifuensis]